MKSDYVSALPDLDRYTWTRIKSVIEDMEEQGADFPEGQPYLIASSGMPKGVGAIRVTRRGRKLVVS